MIDTDKAVTADIASPLEGAGFQVTCVADGHQGLSSMYKHHPDLVIVVEQEPGINMEELCSELRQASLLPIIVVGNRQEGSHEVRLLEAGADAYMSKPPDAAELVARVRSLLRRTKGSEDHSAVLYRRRPEAVRPTWVSPVDGLM